MTNKKNLWDKYMPFIVAFNLVVWSILGFNTFINHKYDLIPKSMEGRSVIILNVQHCANTYNEYCWIDKNELDKLDNWNVALSINEVQLILRSAKEKDREFVSKPPTLFDQEEEYSEYYDGCNWHRCWGDFCT